MLRTVCGSWFLWCPVGNRSADPGNNTKPAVSQEAASTTESVQQTPALTTTTQVTYVQDDISGVVENVMPAMVSIVNQYTTTTRDFWGQSYEKESGGKRFQVLLWQKQIPSF